MTFPSPDCKERVWPIKINICYCTSNVSIPQSQRLIGCQLERASGALTKTIEKGPPFGKRGRKLYVLLLENQYRFWVFSFRQSVEQVVGGRAPGHDEAEWSSVVNGEDEIGSGIGEYQVFWRRGLVFRHETAGAPVGLSGNDVLGYFPSLFVGICDSDS